MSHYISKRSKYLDTQIHLLQVADSFLKNNDYEKAEDVAIYVENKYGCDQSCKVIKGKIKTRLGLYLRGLLECDEVFFIRDIHFFFHHKRSLGT